MTKAEVARLNKLIDQTNAFLDHGTPKVNPQIRNIDVLEALLADVRAVAAGTLPTGLTLLTREAKEIGEL